MLTPISIARSGFIASGNIGWPHMASGAIRSGDLGITAGTPTGTNFLRDDFAWANPSVTIASGTVQSGNIASGAVQGFFGATRNIASGTVGVFDFGSGAVVAGTVGSGAVQSGNIASGQVGHFAIAANAITSGQVGSGAIMGQAGGGPLNIASGTLDNFDFSSGILTSGVYIGSGTILGQAGGGPFNIASGTIGTFDIGSGAVRSGHIASGQVANFAVGSGAVTSGRIGMGGTPTGTNFFRDDFTWASPGAASVSSGAVTQITFASGAGPEYLMAFVSGLNNPFPVITEETVSGVRAVSISQSGHIRVAMAGTSGRMPAIGVVLDNVGSGIQANVYTFGDFQFTSGLADYSGWVGTQLFVGRSGQIVSVSGSFNSGGLLSGDVTQPIGVALNSGAAQFAIATNLPSVLGLISSGMLASGNISEFDIASGAINSGQISSGAVQGFFGGTRNIASGTVGVFDFGSGAVIAGTVGSGAVQSGNIASGQVGGASFASGAITSGWAIGSGALFGRLGPEFLIASGTIGTFDIGSGQVVSGLVGSGQIGHFHIAANAITSGQIGSGAVMGQAGGGPFDIASGTITTNDLGSGAIVSGLVASGQVGTYHFISGAQVDWSQYLLANSSGPSRFPTALTQETVSGVRAVNLTASGHLQVAMASVATRMPACGIVVDNVASGIPANVFLFGQFQFTSGLADYSGYVGTVIAVGRSGQIVSQSGSFNSGGLLSGDTYQPVGYALSSGAAMLQLDAPPVSGVQSTSGSLGSGSVGGFFGTRQIASGTVGVFDFGSGAVIQGTVGSGAIGSGNIASGQVGPNALASGIITSGYWIGSGAIFGQGAGGPFLIASGSVISPDIGSGAIRSGHIASGQVANFAVGSGAITSGRIAMGGTPNGTNFFRDDFTWQPTGGGSVTSGSITQIDLASGLGVEFVMPVISGLTTPFPIITEETISGVRAVSLSQSGNLRIAMAGTSGRMPAIGVVVDNVASGLTCNVFAEGNFQFSSGLADYSGWVGTNLFVGRSGQIVTLSGSFNSGGLLSGDLSQVIGMAGPNSGAALIRVGEFLHSGFFLGSGVAIAGSLGSGAATSGSIASGQVGPNALASGIITSGFWIGSGTILGQAAGSVFDIASGSLGKFDLSSGIITSGVYVGSGTILGAQGGGPRNVASGTLGNFDLSSGIITSGVYVGSGTIMGQAGGGPFQISSGTIGALNLASGIITSGVYIGSGTILGADGGGPRMIASGTIGTLDIGSGQMIDFSQYQLNFTSGLTHVPIITGETISGVRAVNISQSGFLQIAKASVSGRMPAIGVVVDNVASGIQVDVFTGGTFTPSSGLISLSGTYGELLYVGRSGTVSTASGWFNSGGLLSGDITQPIGWLMGSGQMVISVAATIPFVAALITSGNIASGQIGAAHLASGILTSGVYIGSGTILGQAGGGPFNIASGTLASYDVASGTSVTNAFHLMPVNSGGPWVAITSEAISGGKCVCIDVSNSGAIRTAMAAVSGRMPAIGVVMDNVLSGIQCNIITNGYVVARSGVLASGNMIGKSLWVGYSGDIITVSGGYGSGGGAAFSGFMGQRMGQVIYSSSGSISGAYLINTTNPIQLTSGIPVVGVVPAFLPIMYN